VAFYGLVGMTVCTSDVW